MTTLFFVFILMIIIKLHFMGKSSRNQIKEELFPVHKLLFKILLSTQTSFDYVDTTLKQQTGYEENIFTML